MENNAPQKKKISKNAWTFLMALVLWCAMLGVWWACWELYYSAFTPRPWYWKGNLLMCCVYGFILAMVTHFYGGYRVGYYQSGDVILSNVLALIIANCLIYVVLFLIAAAVINPLPLLAMAGAQMLLCALWAVAGNALYTRVFPPRRLLLLYGRQATAQSLLPKLITRSEKYHVQELLSVSEDWAVITHKLGQYDAVILCDMPQATRSRLIKACFERSIRMYITPKITDILIRGTSDIHLFDTPLLLSRAQELSAAQRLTKRSMDIALSLLGIALTAPVMLCAAIAVKAQDGGPVLFRQQRLTLGGRPFYVLKFRSMVVDAELARPAALAERRDERVTRVGRVLRAHRIDELPQFFNVLKGDMSLVGPRPERPELYEKYFTTMPEFSYRLRVKAGITGYAQTQGNYNTTHFDKLKLDLMYIVNYSPFLDVKLLLWTVKTLFQKERSQGVEP